MEIKPISIEEYNKAVEEKQKCFLVFTKENCSVCGRLIPVLEKISDEYKDHPEMHYYNMEIHDPDARALFKSWQLAGVPQTCAKDGHIEWCGREYRRTDQQHAGTECRCAARQ